LKFCIRLFLFEVKKKEVFCWTWVMKKWTKTILNMKWLRNEEPEWRDFFGMKGKNWVSNVVRNLKKLVLKKFSNKTFNQKERKFLKNHFLKKKFSGKKIWRWTSKVFPIQSRKKINWNFFLGKIFFTLSSSKCTLEWSSKNSTLLVPNISQFSKQDL